MVYDEILARLAAFPLFSTLDAPALQSIAKRGVWFSLAGGWELFAEDAPSKAIHFVLSGRLIVVRRGVEGEQVIGYVRAGEPVGEMSLMSGEPHSASVYALRDTEILSIMRDDCERLFDQHGGFAHELARIILARAQRPKESFLQAAPRIFGLIATSPSIDIDARARQLAERINALGMKAAVLPCAEEGPDPAHVDAIEASHDIVLLAARAGGSAWYRFVIRHADRFLVLARRDAKPPQPFPMAEAGDRARRFRLVDLIMLAEGVSACPVKEWIDAVSAARVLHWRGPDSIAHLARIITGKSVGLVLSGGGARAYAHIGAVKALREAGAPIDFVSGASMGAVVAACVAMGWDDREIEERIRAAFVVSNPLGDHVLPVVALTGGERVDARLATHFGEALIEELVLPFFCISSDIAIGESRIHRVGLLRHALRASIALPGILPPVIDDGALLVDGAVINNFPTDVMAQTHRGVTIGIDVARQGVIDIDAFHNPPSFFGWVLQNGFSNAPPIVSLLMRTATARHERMKKVHPADILITPSVEGVELRDWKKYETAVEDGYRAAWKAIEEKGGALVF